MFGELFKEIKSTVSIMRYGTTTRTITVAKPFCTPCRHIITGALDPYGVRIYSYSEAARMANPLTVLRMSSKIAGDGNLKIPHALPIAQVAQVIVSEKAAAWAEYLLLRTGKLYRVGPYINQHNREWAARHGGQMPPAWHEGKPWIKNSCSEGIQAWKVVKEAAKRGQTSVNDRQTAARKPPNLQNGRVHRHVIK